MSAEDTGKVDAPDVDPAVEESLAGSATAPQPGDVEDEAEVLEAEMSEGSVDSETAPEKDELSERTADLQRLSAEFANYRRRVARDKQVDIDNAKASVLAELLGVLDDLDRARKHGDLETGPLKSVADKLESVITAQGLVAFGDEGDAFDPALHEAVQHEGDGNDPVVGSVFRKGYKVRDRVLRTAMVAVVDGSGADAASDQA
ncbi:MULTISPECIES: nucleotide exchange factor GrpE [unclassified Rhodococcus (in: high G+C Gram-positive bacteria)]|uniref:nucleotide exchange factor GrpE n=1 Tax=unclassified Rhodococcus (in: high G+C Gram-positive bacteria) TaxID=192944 RepID=UPI0006920301|nr:MULTISPECIES: nucleotide exchange factor GrpE [unclassified Rhodococcus (in: high G+C Gram-positive bacteria)]MBY6708556.1 nucleotide exchange factor GrpE [Rhodococcus sp. BP-241]MDQ1181885.1 molecular chaperone GrpE [Rhodococcus sp. SORGH_AS_0301]MDQ1203222.1 molecular chaperone GrpE [Rhodococcus sp. SORGH_AS_0303]